MADSVYHATGQVIDSETSQGLPEFTVEAWDAAQTTSRPLAVTVTESDGRFISWNLILCSSALKRFLT